MHTDLRSCLVLSVLLFSMITATAPARADGEVNLYSFRQPQLIEPILRRFGEETGTKVNIVYAETGLLEG
jgi:iron(III) transport system substrate-binding protein